MMKILTIILSLTITISAQIKLQNTILNYPDGKVKSISSWYASDSKATPLLEGPQHEFFPNGQVKSERHYQSGRLHGFFKSWDSQGTLRESYQFKNGYKR